MKKAIPLIITAAILVTVVTCARANPPGVGDGCVGNCDTGNGNNGNGNSPGNSTSSSTSTSKATAVAGAAAVAGSISTATGGMGGNASATGGNATGGAGGMGGKASATATGGAGGAGGLGGAGGAGGAGGQGGVGQGGQGGVGQGGQGGVGQGGNASGASSTVTVSTAASKAAYAPDVISTPTAPCRIGVGASAGWLGGSLGISGSVLDEGCDIRETSRMLHNLGFKEAAVQALCLHQPSKKALEAVGVKCLLTSETPTPTTAPQ